MNAVLHLLHLIRLMHMLKAKHTSDIPHTYSLLSIHQKSIWTHRLNAFECKLIHIRSSAVASIISQFNSNFFISWFAPSRSHSPSLHPPSALRLIQFSVPFRCVWFVSVLVVFCCCCHFFGFSSPIYSTRSNRITQSRETKWPLSAWFSRFIYYSLRVTLSVQVGK